MTHVQAVLQPFAYKNRLKSPVPQVERTKIALLCMIPWLLLLSLIWSPPARNTYPWQRIQVELWEFQIRKQILLLVMPYLQVVVCVCAPGLCHGVGDVLTNSKEKKHDKSCSSSAIDLCSSCGIGNFYRFCVLSSHTTACKRCINKGWKIMAVWR